MPKGDYAKWKQSHGGDWVMREDIPDDVIERMFPDDFPLIEEEDGETCPDQMPY